MNDMSTITGSNITTSGTTTDTISIGGNHYDASVQIGEAGLTMKPECDIVFGDHSLKDFMSKVEERLNILRVNPKLEDKWNELSELGNRYRELEKELLEKEKMWKILKDDT
jgi:hypothetical protein